MSARRAGVKVKTNRCALAEQFYQWASVHCADALYSSSHVVINQTKIMLLDEFYSLRKLSEPRCRYLMEPTPDHTCLWHIFEDVYIKLRDAELKLAPPQLYLLPPTPPSPLPPQIEPPKPNTREFNGLLLGEFIDGDGE